MASVKLHGLIEEVYHSEKSGNDYITVIDKDGGKIKLVSKEFDVSKLERLVPVVLDLVVRGRIYRDGNCVLEVMSISAAKS